jgi:hypothetical protein
MSHHSVAIPAQTRPVVSEFIIIQPNSARPYRDRTQSFGREYLSSILIVHPTRMSACPSSGVAKIKNQVRSPNEEKYTVKRRWAESGWETVWFVNHQVNEPLVM